jgi:TPR repeat protein
MKKIYFILLFINVSIISCALTHSLELESSAEAGDANSQYLMCHCYIDGLGVECNYEKAFEWCEKAATQGHKNAMTQMGYFYFSGNK